MTHNESAQSHFIQFDNKTGKPKKQPTIRFNLRTDKIIKTGHAPIELIYQIGGQRKYYNVGIKVMPSNWDAEGQRAIYVDKRTAKKGYPSIDYDLFLTQGEADSINAKLTVLVQHIREDIEKGYVSKKIPFSSAMVIDVLKNEQIPSTKKESPSKFLYDFIDRYIDEHKTTREPGSLTVYKSLKKHLQDYETVKKWRVSFTTIDYAFFQSFQNFLIEHKKLSNTTVAKQISTIKTFLGYAKKNGVEVSDKYKDFKIKRESLEVIALTNVEFETLYYYDLTNNKRLAQVRDVFCFSCLTGLRYSDLHQLKREHIKDDEIKLTVKKTKEALIIPLTPLSAEILLRYEGMHHPLPVISNQKMNDYIKELCQLVGITEPIEIVRYRGAKREAVTYPKYELIGVHTGRKTFVTLSLERGMSAEEVMEVTGHKDYQSFKRYVKITEQRKKVVMLKAWPSTKKSAIVKAI